MSLRTRTLAAAILAGLVALAPTPSMAQSVSGEPLRLENAKRAVAHEFKSASAAPAAALRFQPLAASRIEALARHNESGNKRLQIGIGRDVSDEAASPLAGDLAWTPVPGGRVLRLDITSPDAAALRVGIDPTGLPAGAELRVAGGSRGGIEFADLAAMQAGIDGEGVYWTPVTDGETQRLELFVPNGAPAVQPRIEGVSHLLASPLRPLSLAKQLGGSGACNIDVVCRATALGQAFVNAENAVARMVFTIGADSFTCTGTLLNDATPATQVPYFYSAAHCFNTQTVASTLSTFWNYETATCGVSSAGPNVQVPGGADLLFSSLQSDALFLRLRNPPPAGAFFVGWNANTLTAPTPVVAIHHPLGDNKKVSRGSHSGFQADVQLTATQTITSVARASWTEGTTERGSSGSGLFTLAGSEYQLRGGLAGGFAACSNVGQSEAAGNVDWYSRFDQVFPSLQQWLGTPAAVGPTRDYTGAWFVPAESGWGLTVFNFPGQLFALFFVYDTQGRPSWYRMQGAWTGTDVVATSLERATGPAWAASFNPSSVSFAPVGTATLTFTSATAATLTFNDGTVNRTVTLTKI